MSWQVQARRLWTGMQYAHREPGGRNNAVLEKQMTTIQGPAIFLAQFAGDKAPFNSLAEIGKTAASSI
jgi:hypothetical protein